MLSKVWQYFFKPLLLFSSSSYSSLHKRLHFYLTSIKLTLQQTGINQQIGIGHIIQFYFHMYNFYCSHMINSGIVLFVHSIVKCLFLHFQLFYCICHDLNYIYFYLCVVCSSREKKKQGNWKHLFIVGRYMRLKMSDCSFIPIYEVIWIAVEQVRAK